MSPEQTRGDDLDPRSDLFSLGILAYELFCGQRPFDGDNLNDLIGAIRRGTFRPASAVRPELPVALDAVLGKALAGDPAQRWPDARSFAAAIEEVAREAGWTTGPLAVAATVAALCPEEVRTSSTPESGTQVAAKPIVPEKTVPAAAAVRELARADTDPAPLPPEPPAADLSPKPRRWPLALAVVGLALVVGLGWVLSRPAQVREWAVEIQPTPDTADVYVGGTRVGTGVTTWRAAPGSLQVELRLEGYKTFREELVLDERGGVYPLRPVLQRNIATGRVVVTLDPPNAVLMAGSETLTAVDKMAGTYEFDRAAGVVALAAKLEGYTPWRANVLVRTGSTVSVPVKLRPEPVKVQVRGRRKAEGRVVIEADEFRTECGLPCTQRVPHASMVKVQVTLDGIPGTWVKEQPVTPGSTLTFIAPVPDPVREPKAKLRAYLSGQRADGKPTRVSLVDANVLKRPRGSRRAKIDGVVAVTFRYVWDEAGGLRVTLATDPYSTVSLNGKGIGTTPLVGWKLTPGNHRFRLKEHAASVTVRFER
jgi:hypothetical protein